MSELSIADKIWNRACLSDSKCTHAGDAALKSMIRFHGKTMNGGVLHAVESSSMEELVTAQESYRYFGLQAVAELISHAQEAIDQDIDSGEDDLGDLEEEFDELYGSSVPYDETLRKAFESHLKREPNEYAEMEDGRS